MLMDIGDNLSQYKMQYICQVFDQTLNSLQNYTKPCSDPSFWIFTKERLVSYVSNALDAQVDACLSQAIKVYESMCGQII